MKFFNFSTMMAASLVSLTGSNAGALTTCPCDKLCVPGFRTLLRLVPKCEITSHPGTVADTIIAAAATPLIGDYVLLDGDIVLSEEVEGEGYWREFEIIDESGNITDTMIGTKGARSFDTVALFRLACVDRDLKGFSKLVANGCFVVSIQNKNGVWENVGTLDNPAHFETILLSRGALAADANEGAFTVKANTGFPAFDYEGVFDLTPNPAP